MFQTGFNRRVAGGVSSPISEVRSWVAGGSSRPDLPLIDVAQAAPGYPPDSGLARHVAGLDQARVSRYGPVLGEAELREAVADDISNSYGAAVHPEQVAITAGANQAFCLAVSALCEPGDRVILPAPYYFNHDMWLDMAGVERAYLDCPDDGMLPSSEGADALVDGRTRAIVLVTPNNPTGRVYPPELISAFARLAADRGLYLIIDETYHEFRSDSGPAHDLFGDPLWARTLVRIHSFSKVYSIPGYRVGSLVASRRLLHEVDKLADCLTICPNRMGQEAALYGLRHLEGWVAGNRAAIGRRISRFAEAMRDSPYRVVSSGGFFAYVRHPFRGEPGLRVARRLFEERSVLALAGEMFGQGQEGYLRLAFANLEDADIPQLVRRLDESAERAP